MKRDELLGINRIYDYLLEIILLGNIIKPSIILFCRNFILLIKNRFC
jgi:hypothetical protein